MTTDSIYEPELMTVEAVIGETPDVKTLRLSFHDTEAKEIFAFKAGQFGVFSVFGEGEAPFGIANSPTRADHVEFSVKLVGRVTHAIHALNAGDTVGFRGPYGNGFPIEDMKGKNLVFAGGGIGMAPLRSLLWNCLDTRDDFGDIVLVYGARSTADLVYKSDLEKWSESRDLRTVLTVDPGGEDPSWKGEIGFVPAVLENVAPSSDNAVVITCGPPIMIRFVIASLSKMGFAPEQIITTLEMKMKCGLGKCGRCNIGPAYVCKHGPVFTYEELRKLPAEY